MADTSGLGLILKNMMKEDNNLENFMMIQDRLQQPTQMRDIPSNPTMNVGTSVRNVNVGAVLDPKQKQLLTLRAGMPIGEKTYLSGNYSPKGSFNGGKMFGINIERKF